MNILTSRLRLEPIREDHADIVFEELANSKIYRFIADTPPVSKESLRERYRFLQNGRSPDGSEYWLNWIAFIKETNQPIGYFQATIKPEHPSNVAYVVFPKYWRRGYAFEAMTALVRHLLITYKVPVLISEMDTRNEASIGLVNKLGFKLTATTRDAAFFHGETSHEYKYEFSLDKISQHSRTS